MLRQKRKKEIEKDSLVNQASVVAKNVCLTAGKISLKHFQDLCFLKSLLEEFIYICSQIKPNKPEDLIGNNPFRTALSKYKSQNPTFPARRLFCNYFLFSSLFSSE